MLTHFINHVQCQYCELREAISGLEERRKIKEELPPDRREFFTLSVAAGVAP
jgi:hypothetical protein